jgi:hypothetical protein
MPLVALDTAADLILDLTCVDEPTWAAVWRARTGDRLRCRGCGQPLHAKMRAATGSRWFAHTAAVPECPHLGETERHINLKREFAEAFRVSGWTATPEAAGDGYRADVLVTSPAGQRVAVEVQVSPIAADLVGERTRRHSAAGLSTLWVAVDRRPDWTLGHSTVLIDESDRVADTVVVAMRERGHSALAVAGSASIGRFVERFAEGRITAVDDPHGVWAELLPRTSAGARRRAHRRGSRSFSCGAGCPRG